MVVPVSTAAAVDTVNTTRLEKAVTVNGILSHERVLQRIANQNGGTRASGTEGYRQSLRYVRSTLQAAGYSTVTQPFTFSSFTDNGTSVTQVSPTPGEYETAVLEYSGAGNVTGTVVPAKTIAIPPGNPGSTTSGCSASDFTPASTTQPQVALIQRGFCDFGTKVANAAAAGYDAALIFNEGQDGRTDVFQGTLGAPAAIPAAALSYADGSALVAAARAGAVTVNVTANVVTERKTTWNLIADSTMGDAGKTVVVGAHLDSVSEGPGINDNGSGTATILEIAVQMSKLKITPRQKLRFAFWGAEESGLLGSEYYVNSLNNDQLAQIYANLNFDMLGSPNYVRFVYDGDGSSGGPSGPAGSAQIEEIFANWFAGKGLATAPTDFDGRSDYGPFIAAGIPAGGLFSGAEGVKTEEEATIFGGTAGEAYDACYHQACDDITNLSTQALNELGDAAARATMTLALTKTGFFPDGSRMQARQQLDMSQFAYRGNHLVK
ncbi:M20/M25/M40 family metallo-hydrolase [Nakamurella flava]|uniref:M20/M25/M40 family metallo-hydrolase n=1 Tax=Nakamurella flava TaxID=2576308 RepID=A0A4U6QFV5_9ACTN|nr:M20/M25/M40 family metallo-hydrolase [Nakamurella flava]